MIRVIFSSDWHLGLRTNEIDRTDEIISVGKQVVKHCKKVKEDHKVVLVLGGDIFNTNTPSEHHIGRFIEVLNLIRKHEINTYIMVGNHDSIADPERISCLSFIRKIKSAYPTITLVEDIKYLFIEEQDYGSLHFTFLPHISKALVHKKIKDGKYDGVENTQAYIDHKCTKIMKKVGKMGHNYIFSHLNVIGAHPGSESNLLKKSEVYLPESFTSPPLGWCSPTIIQGHIHSNSIMGDINIIGSPIYCGFGESGDKYFADITIKGSMGDQDTIDLVKTHCRPFMELELDMIGETKPFFKLPDVIEFLDDLKEQKDPVAKIDVTIDPEHNTYDWTEIRNKILKIGFIKPITPRVVIKRTVRSKNQTIDLPIKDKIKVYLKRNMKKDLPRAKRIYKRTQKYLEA